MVRAGIPLVVCGAGAQLVYFAAPQYFVNAPQWLWGIFFWSGIILILLGLCFLLFSGLPESKIFRVFIYGFIPLQKAAKIAYEKNRNSTAGKWAETALFSHPGDPLGWFAHALIGNTQETSIDVYGCKPQFDILEKIPYREVKSFFLVITDKDAILRETSKKNIKYNRLHIRRSDMKKRIKEILTWNMPDE